MRMTLLEGGPRAASRGLSRCGGRAAADETVDCERARTRDHQIEESEAEQDGALAAIGDGENGAVPHHGDVHPPEKKKKNKTKRRSRHQKQSRNWCRAPSW